MKDSGACSLAGKRALVSGGTTGIGRAIVELFVQNGMKVATFARTESDIEELRKAMPEVLAFTTDVANCDELESAVEKTIAEFGGLDILVNNAGVSGDSVTDTPYREWKSVLEINLLGPMLLTQIASEHLGFGAHIVTIGSLSAKSRGEGTDVYVASKTGIRGFADAVGKGLATKGVLHTLIEPGSTEADMTTEGKTEEEVRKLKADHKMMEAADVARSVLYAVSQPANMVVTRIEVHPRVQSK